MTSASSSMNMRGFTKGFYAGHTVRFYYSKNFSCKQPPASTASSKCEGGTNYTQTPASTFDPLYVIVPLGFTPPKWTLQCPAGTCIDHPHTIDLTSVLGSGTGNLTLPAHSHISSAYFIHVNRGPAAPLGPVPGSAEPGSAQPTPVLLAAAFWLPNRRPRGPHLP